MRRVGSRERHFMVLGALLYWWMYRMSFRRRSGTEVKTPRAMTSRSILANHNSTWLSQEEKVGAKCKWTLGGRSRNSVTRLVLCADRLSAITWISLAAGWLTTMSARKATNSAEVCRAAVLPSTSPVLVLNAAYRDNVPCR